mmetsp:Transcript_18733/g.35692  ORF Transcript_18733/g.35692 Transcript_18733/m.35692 type:complete len:277 (-) Transcript_18733:3890-4720(-)
MAIGISLGQVFHNHHFTFHGCAVVHQVALFKHVLVLIGRHLSCLARLPQYPLMVLDEQGDQEKHHTLHEHEDARPAHNVHVHHVLYAVRGRAHLVVVVRDVKYSTAHRVVRKQSECPLGDVRDVSGAGGVDEILHDHSSHERAHGEEAVSSHLPHQRAHGRGEGEVAYVRERDGRKAKAQQQQSDAGETVVFRELVNVERRKADDDGDKRNHIGKHVRQKGSDPKHKLVHAAHHLKMLGVVHALPHQEHAEGGRNGTHAQSQKDGGDEPLDGVAVA